MNPTTNSESDGTKSNGACSTSEYTYQLAVSDVVGIRRYTRRHIKKVNFIICFVVFEKNKQKRRA